MSQDDDGAVFDDADGKKTKRGYATRSLGVVAEDDERYWSVADAARLLGPPMMTEAQVRNLIHLASLEPQGKRRGGSRRRHVRVYDASEILRAHSAISTVMKHG
jgi:hypothetical protein